MLLHSKAAGAQRRRNDDRLLVWLNGRSGYARNTSISRNQGQSRMGTRSMQVRPHDGKRLAGFDRDSAGWKTMRTSR
jgi:hypothetical protein